MHSITQGQILQKENIAGTVLDERGSFVKVILI
jgi:hypothetical protein